MFVESTTKKIPTAQSRGGICSPPPCASLSQFWFEIASLPAVGGSLRERRALRRAEGCPPCQMMRFQGEIYSGNLWSGIKTLAVAFLRCPCYRFRLCTFLSPTD